MEEIVKQVQGNLKVAQDWQKSQADLKGIPKEFQVGEHVFIKVRPKKSSLRLVQNWHLITMGHLKFCLGLDK